MLWPERSGFFTFSLMVLFGPAMVASIKTAIPPAMFRDKAAGSPANTNRQANSMEASYTGYLHHLICSFKLVNRGLPTMMWSSKSISSNFPASINCLVTSMSSFDGDGSELGWLCATRMLGQLRTTA
jgi:hypothetical protein